MSSQKFLVVFRQLRGSGARLSPKNWTRPLGRVRFSRPHPPKTIDEVVRCGEGPLTTPCGTRRALEVVRVLPLKLGRIRRIGGSAIYPSAGLGINYSADHPLTGAEEDVVGSGRRRPW